MSGDASGTTAMGMSMSPASRSQPPPVLQPQHDGSIIDDAVKPIVAMENTPISSCGCGTSQRHQWFPPRRHRCIRTNSTMSSSPGRPGDRQAGTPARAPLHGDDERGHAEEGDGDGASIRRAKVGRRAPTGWPAPRWDAHRQVDEEHARSRRRDDEPPSTGPKWRGHRPHGPHRGPNRGVRGGTPVDHSWSARIAPRPCTARAATSSSSVGAGPRRGRRGEHRDTQAEEGRCEAVAEAR